MPRRPLIATCEYCGRDFQHQQRAQRFCSYRCRGYGITAPAHERFLSKVRIGGADECHLWTGATNDGYGVFFVGKTLIRSHRFAWEQEHGQIPEGMMACHRCDVRACVNVRHLFLGTAKENAEDMVSKGRQQRGETSARAKLSEEQVRGILASTLPSHQLASILGVSADYPSVIRRRKRWTHLETA